MHQKKKGDRMQQKLLQTYHIKFGLRRLESLRLERVDEPWERRLVGLVPMPAIDRNCPRDVSDPMAALFGVQLAGGRKSNIVVVFADSAFDGSEDVQDAQDYGSPVDMPQVI